MCRQMVSGADMDRVVGLDGKRSSLVLGVLGSEVRDELWVLT